MRATGSFAAIRKDAAFWSANLFGTLTAAASIISIVQHLFDVSLVPAFARGLLAYRYIAHTVTDWVLAPFVYAIEHLSIWLQYPLAIDVPNWWIDLTIISIVSSGALMRAHLRMRQAHYLTWTQRIGIFAATLFCGIITLGILWLMVLIGVSLARTFNVNQRFNPALFYDNADPIQLGLEVVHVYYRRAMIAIVLASAGFFLVNYFVL